MDTPKLQFFKGVMFSKPSFFSVHIKFPGPTLLLKVYRDPYERKACWWPLSNAPGCPTKSQQNAGGSSNSHLAVLDPEKKLNFIFPTKYGIPNSLKGSWTQNLQKKLGAG